MIGIYKITNNINSKLYIGKSIDIKRRWAEHKRYYRYIKSSHLYRAILKYGILNFSFDVVELCSKEKLNEKECYYINLYNTTNPKYGYNITEGGDGGPIYIGINNKKAVLSEEIVFLIRELYKNGYLKKQAYAYINEIYNINKNTFSDVWIGKTYKNIHYDVYNINKEELKNRRNINKSKTTNTYTKKYVLDIRNLKNLGLPRIEVYAKYREFMNENTFNTIWNNQVYKYIQSNIPKQYTQKYVKTHKRNNPVDMYSIENVFEKHFNSIDEALKEIKGQWNKNYVTQLYNVCIGKSKSYLGHAWKFSNCND